MYFKRIEMHGFKSFAEPVTIEFDKGITCVVGPNGSGKSNISDAIRWVLGEQSPKMLRGGKMEDVIFAGTASRKSRGMAEVTLVIDNSTGILPIEYQEVAITRRMYRSGESEYAINNNQCRMRDVRELLMDTGIGVDGYSLIGQGKISDIISNKTESIREIFEETAGIVSYRSKKAEAERKLNSANVNMDRVNDIISEIEGRIGSLKEDHEKASEYLELRDRHKELEINITVNNIEDISNRAKVLSDDLESLDKELGLITSERAALDEQIREAKTKLDNYEELEEKAGEDLRETERILNQCESERNINRERLNSMEKDTLRITKEIEDIEEKIEREKQNSEELFERKRGIDEKHRELENQLTEEIARNTDIIQKKAKLTENIDEKKNEIFTMSNKKSGWIAEKNSLSGLFENLERSRLNILKDKASGEDNYDRVHMEYDVARNRENDLAKVLEEAIQEKNAAVIKRNALIESGNNMSKELQDVGIRLGQSSARKKAIEEMESNYEGYNGGVKFVMKSTVGGIHGVVAELMEVPSGFEVALETALGASMQNIVCQDDRTAKEAVASLKNNRAGRVTFLPLESIKPRNVIRNDKIEKETGFEGYGVDCIKFDSKYRTIMEYLLGNVVVVDNMDNAIKISKLGNKGIKLVTLEGEIINPSGAVTGGKYRNHTANLLERKSEVTKLEEEIIGLQRKQSLLEEDSHKNRKALMEIDGKIEKGGLEIRAFEMDFVNVKNQVEILKKTIDGFKDESQRWETTIGSIEEEKTKAQKDIDNIQNKIENADKGIKELEVEIEADSSALENISEAIENAGEAITRARIKATSCESEKENVDNLVEMISAGISQLVADREEKQRQIENIKLDTNAMGEGLINREKTIMENVQEKERLSEYLKNLNEEKIEISRVYRESFDIKEELNQKTTKLQNQKYEIDVKLARQDGQLDTLKNKLWEDFEVPYIQAVSMTSEDFVMSTAVKENRDIKNRIKELGEVNIGAIKEYQQVSERYEFLTEQRADIQKSTDELNHIIGDMDKVIREKFKESFDQVVTHFESTFVEFFGGGNAKITLDKEDDPLNATIEISVQPPGKQLKNINLLSGGEKTMTAIALMFAVLKTKPTPCCILDEVEAALDDHNIHVFANYLRKFDNIQFTLITHQKTTMEHADVMYGVTMPERGISRVFSLRMGDELPV